jgi:hypothetical protein
MTEAGTDITKPSRQVNQINVNISPDLPSDLLAASLKNPNASDKQQHTAPPVDDASSPSHHHDASSVVLTLWNP